MPLTSSDVASSHPNKNAEFNLMENLFLMRRKFETLSICDDRRPRFVKEAWRRWGWLGARVVERDADDFLVFMEREVSLIDPLHPVMLSRHL